MEPKEGNGDNMQENFLFNYSFFATNCISIDGFNYL